MRLLIAVLFTTLFAWTVAQDFSGSFTQSDDPTTVLELESAGDSDYVGTLLNEGRDRFRVAAIIDNGQLLGLIYLREAGFENDLAFTATLVGNTLELTTVFVDENIDPLTEEGETYTFARAGAAPAATPANPLAPAAGATFAGDYSGQGVQLSLRQDGTGFQGELTFQGQVYLVQAQPAGQGLSGTFVADGQNFAFEAIPNGNGLTLTSGGQSYSLVRTAAPAAVVPNTPAPAAPAPATGGEGVLQPGQAYPGGTRVSSPGTGISFVVPQGLSGGYEPSFGGFLMANQTGDTILYVEAAGQLSALGLGEGAVEGVAAAVGQELQLLSAPQQQGDAITVSFLLGDAMLYGTARQGPAGNAVVVLGYGYQPQLLEQLVGSVSSSVAFASPQPASDGGQLAGLLLTSTGGDNLYSPGGVGNGSFTSQDERQIAFCGDGSYGFESRSVSIASVDGAGSLSSEESDAHRGRYYFTSSLMGETAVVLEANDGRTFVQLMVIQGQVVYFDGQPHQVAASQYC